MKTDTIFLFCVSLLFTITQPAIAKDYDIKMVHFVPADETSTAQERDTIRRFTKATQDFYRTEMARHGHAQKTFELDDQVYVINGRKKANQYTSIKQLDTDFQPFRDTHGNRHGYLVFVDIETIPVWGCGVAHGGRAYIGFHYNVPQF